MTTGATASLAAAAEPLAEPPWSLEPGAAIVPYEVRSRFEKSVARTLGNPNFRPGHVWHDIPPRYVESLVVGQNRIPDPAIARLFDDVQLATQAPLLAPGRFAAIWRLNTGHDYGTDAAWRNGAQPMRAQGRRPGASPASAVAPGQRG